MTTLQSLNQFAIIPDLPRAPLTNKEGYMTDQWRLFFDQLIIALQYYIKPEGIVVPQQSASNIALFTATQFIANIVYDSTNSEFKGNINGTWKTFLS